MEASGYLKWRLPSAGVSLLQNPLHTWLGLLQGSGSTEEGWAGCTSSICLWSLFPHRVGRHSLTMMIWEAHFSFQKHVSSQSPKLLRMPHGKQSIIRDAQRKRGEFQKKILLQSNTSVEKVSHV